MWNSTGCWFRLPPWVGEGLASLQEEPNEWTASQSHFWQPVPLLMLQVSGAQRSQFWPSTFDLQGHWPLCWSHSHPSGEEQAHGNVPTGSHMHSGGGAGARTRGRSKVNGTEALLASFREKGTGNADRILTLAALSDSVAIVTRFAVLACIALSVVQAPETGACLGVT